MGTVVTKRTKDYEIENQDQRSKSKEIDQQLHREKEALDFESKLLLLGAAEAGKSTIIKQMRILHDKGFSKMEIEQQKTVIHDNIIQAMATIIQAMRLFDITLEDTSVQVYAAFVVAYATDKSHVPFTPAVQHGLTRLWNDKGIRETFNRSSEYQLIDCAEYFFNQLERIGAANYVPTQEDILHARVETTGIVEMKFRIRDLDVKVIDVGGQRSERMKWIHLFDNVSGVMFVASLSEYDQKLKEDNQTVKIPSNFACCPGVVRITKLRFKYQNQNRLQESLNLFNFICNHGTFLNSAVILFLNKKDLFEQKIKKVPLNVACPDYKGYCPIDCSKFDLLRVE